MDINLREQAKRLRRNPTTAERFLWERLRAKRLSGYKFRRQSVIGPYIVDFVCLRQKLVIELDGSQHDFSRDHDGRRSAWLERQGFRVVRFWNQDVETRTDDVVRVILTHLAGQRTKTDIDVEIQAAEIR